MEPIEKNDPINDTSAVVMGPAISGDSADRSIASDGDNQPIALPWHSVTMLTIYIHIYMKEILKEIINSRNSYIPQYIAKY